MSNLQYEVLGILEKRDCVKILSTDEENEFLEKYRIIFKKRMSSLPSKMWKNNGSNNLIDFFKMVIQDEGLIFGKEKLYLSWDDDEYNVIIISAECFSEFFDDLASLPPDMYIVDMEMKTAISCRAEDSVWLWV